VKFYFSLDICWYLLNNEYYKIIKLLKKVWYIIF
jgi:hypothetical protein